MSQYLASEWAAVGTPKGPIVHISVQLTAASMQGRALVASASETSLSRAQSAAPAQPRGQAGREPQPLARQRPGLSQTCQPAILRQTPVARRPTAEERAARNFAEDEENRAIARFRSVFRAAAVSATPQSSSPDHYGLGRHIAENARQAHSPIRSDILGHAEQRQERAPPRRALDARETLSPSTKKVWKSRPVEARK